MIKLKTKLDNYKELIELTLSGIIFIYLIINGSILSTTDFSSVVYALLSFIIILELIKMIEQYIFTQHIQIILVIDTFSIFVLREIILALTDKKLTDKIIPIINFNDFSFGINAKIFYVVVGSFLLFVFFKFRKKSMKEFRYEKNFETCLSKNDCDSYEE